MELIVIEFSTICRRLASQDPSTKMMKFVTVLLLVAAVGFTAAAEVKIQQRLPAVVGIANSFRSYVFLSQTGAQTTRQAQPSCTQNILDVVPQDCINGATAVNDELLEKLDPATFKALGDVICQPRCGDPYIEYSRNCLGGQGGQQIIDGFVQFCGINSQGKSCYSEDVISALRVPGFGSCKTDPSSCNCPTIQAGIDSVGCCINIVDGGGILDITGMLQEVCSSLNIPEPCVESSLSGAVAPIVHMGALFGTLVVLLSLVVL